MGDADDALPEPGGWVFRRIPLQRRMERLCQKQAALAGLLFRQEPGQRHLQDAVCIADLYAVGLACLYQVIPLGDARGRKQEVPKPAGDPFRPQRRLRGDDLIVFRIPLDIQCVHGADVIVQPGEAVQDLPYLRGNHFSVQYPIPPFCYRLLRFVPLLYLCLIYLPSKIFASFSVNAQSCKNY